MIKQNDTKTFSKSRKQQKLEQYTKARKESGEYSHIKEIMKKLQKDFEINHDISSFANVNEDVENIYGYVICDERMINNSDYEAFCKAKPKLNKYIEYYDWFQNLSTFDQNVNGVWISFYNWFNDDDYDENDEVMYEQLMHKIEKRQDELHKNGYKI